MSDITQTDLETVFQTLIEIGIERFDTNKKLEILDRLIEILEQIQDEVQ